MYRRHYYVPSDVTKYQQYLRQHFVMKEDPDHQTLTPVMAAQVDHERCVSTCFASLSFSLPYFAYAILHQIMC